MRAALTPIPRRCVTPPGSAAQALELRTTVVGIAASHADVRLLGAVRAQLDASAQLLGQSLLCTLHAATSLPDALAALGHLRRMRVADEAGLRATFLSGCSARLAAEVSHAVRQQAEPYRQCLCLLQLSRQGLFEAATQYGALFGTEAGLGQAALPLRGWLALRASELRLAVGSLLPAVSDCGLLCELLQAAHSASASLCRVGADLGSLLLPSFEQALLAVCARGLERAVRHWAGALSRLQAARDQPGAGGSVTASASASSAFERTAPPADGARGAAVRSAARGPGHAGARLIARIPRSAPSISSRAGQPQPLAPPRSLLAWAPLSLLANALVLVLSELRKCALLPIEPGVRAAVEGALRQCVARLHAFGAEAGASAEAVAGLSEGFGQALLPFVDAMLDALFGGQAAAGGQPAGGYRAGQLTRLLRPRLAPLTARRAEPARAVPSAPAELGAPAAALAGRDPLPGALAPVLATAPASSVQAAMGAANGEGGCGGSGPPAAPVARYEQLPAQAEPAAAGTTSTARGQADT